MRADPSSFEVTALLSLHDTVSLLAREPGQWLPIAGGTDVMVQYAAGKLPARKLVSIWNLPELRRVDVTEEEVRIGAGCTYTDLREHKIIAREFPLLRSAAGWTGGIANQNRGTLGGNIVNASPAADSLPALLVYDAQLILISVRGERRISYTAFHTGYKKISLAVDELVQSVCLPRRFSNYFCFTRKVGTRKAQAISKVSIAALGRVERGLMQDVHIAAASVAPFPLRLTKTELVVNGRALDADLLRLAGQTAAGEIQPIDDIRSTLRYRARVTENLVTEFLRRLNSADAHAAQSQASEVLAQWNSLSTEEAARAILPCCGSSAWARGMALRRPLAGEAELLAASAEVWRNLTVSDWMEAFRSHPRIGEKRLDAGLSATAQSVEWSTQEQRHATASDTAVQSALVEANREYERRFNRIFIVCATGKSAEEILESLRKRLNNDAETELYEAAEQQRQITDLRLKKWLQ